MMGKIVDDGDAAFLAADFGPPAHVLESRKRRRE